MITPAEITEVLSDLSPTVTDGKAWVRFYVPSVKKDFYAEITSDPDECLIYEETIGGEIDWEPVFHRRNPDSPLEYYIKEFLERYVDKLY